MNKLNYKTLEEQGYQGYLLKEAPERILQFGEGNFMRAFVDYFVDVMNEKTDFNSKVVLVQPTGRHTGPDSITHKINEQEGLYTLYLRGFEKGQKVNDKRIISCVSRCLNVKEDYEAVMACAENPELRFITCNTTEAGIVYDPACQFTEMPPASYPAKLTQFLYRRFQAFGQETGKGFVILACELIEENGKALKKCVLDYAKQWNLEEAFLNWIEKENLFCSTLVDRIVTGYPKNEAESLNECNGYEDNLIDTGEVFGFWVIEGPDSLKKELPFEEAGLPVLITDNHKPYKQRKVRILNGAHTSMVLGAYLAGQDIVRDCMDDETILSFMNKTIYEEIIPTLSLPAEDCKDFAFAVTERFKNPFIAHALLSISLNSTSKWRARVMPSLEGYVEKFGRLPECITASFAFYLAFYRGTELTDKGLAAKRSNGDSYTVSDDKQVLEFFYAHKDAGTKELVHDVCTNTEFWGRDLSELPDFETEVTSMLDIIETKGAYALMEKCCN